MILQMFKSNYRFLTHETSRVVGIGADLSVDFDEPLHDDLGNLTVGQGVLQTVTKKNHHWK